MALPLPNLDTRRWADLVDEARAHVPRYAPAWTDHNVHDPGITVLELLAWVVEQDVYRVNRVPDRHRRKFLALAGFAPRPPAPAEVVLEVSAADGTKVPAGSVFDSGPVAVRTTAPVVVQAVALAAVLSDDGTQVSDLTRAWRNGDALPAFGPGFATAGRTHTVRAGDTLDSLAVQYEATEAALRAANRLTGSNLPVGRRLEVPASTAFYLGLDQSPAPGVPLDLWVEVVDSADRRDLQAERDAVAEENRRPWSVNPCVPAPAPAAAAPAPFAHHSARIVWEYFAGDGRWHELSATEAADDTRSLTLSGPVRVTLPGLIKARKLDPRTDELFYLRCRPQSGGFDAPPAIRRVVVNAAPAVQSVPAGQRFEIRAGAPVTGAPTAGAVNRFAPTFDPTGRIAAIDFTATGPDVPEARVVSFSAPTATQPGELVAELVYVGAGDGTVLQRLTLPGAPVVADTVRLWAAGRGWAVRTDLDAAGRADPWAAPDPTTGELRFGDGECGLVVPAGAAVVAAYETTRGAGGNVSAGSKWVRRGQPAVTAVSPGPGRRGADAETLAHAAGRAAEFVWAHERLVELCVPPIESLDAADPAEVRDRVAPPRAANLPDFERLALAVPGTRVRRARAWAGFDPAFPGLRAPGTVAVVIVPELPAGRPEPTPGLVRAVHCYLERRKVVGTRIVVAGPRYVVVSVRAAVTLRRGARAGTTLDAIREAVTAFLDPLAGGPDGRGWPFGRDVFRSEVLQVIAGVPGVDAVARLELVPDAGEPGCGNVCVPPGWLAAPGEHDIQAAGGAP